MSRSDYCTSLSVSLSLSLSLSLYYCTTAPIQWDLQTFASARIEHSAMSADPCKVAMSAHLSRTKTERDISHERRQQRKQHRYNGVYRPLQVASLHYECRPLQGGYESTCKGLWIPLYRWLWVHLQRSVNPIVSVAMSPLAKVCESHWPLQVHPTRRVGQTWLYQISNSMSLMFERELISAYDRLFGSRQPHRD